MKLKRTQKQEARRARQQPVRKDYVFVNVSCLAPNNSYGTPAFVQRGYYEDVKFTCNSCGKQEVWSPTQQKWWYEVAKGLVYSTATRCRPCRRRERDRKAAARKVHLDGIARKRSASK